MLSFTGGLKTFIAMEPCEMRKGFEGLHAAVCERLKEDGHSGALFVFTNKRHTQLEVLYFDGSELWLMTKRLEKGTQTDETPVEYLSPGNGETKQGYLWTCKRPGADTTYTWATSRAAACLKRIIPADVSGTVQCDGCAAYPPFAKRSDGRITLAAFWAHARRKIHEAKDSAPQRAGWLLLQIHRSSTSTASKSNRAKPKPEHASARPCAAARTA